MLKWNCDTHAIVVEKMMRLVMILRLRHLMDRMEKAMVASVVVKVPADKVAADKTANENLRRTAWRNPR